MSVASSRLQGESLLNQLSVAAALAPSPDNNQPWRFLAEDGRWTVLLDPRDALPSDVEHLFDLMSVGAALENALIAAAQAGAQGRVRYLFGTQPARDDRLLPAACVTLEPGATADPLFAALRSRGTCRKLYCTHPVAEHSLARLSQEARRAMQSPLEADDACRQPGVQLDWITDRRAIRAMAALVAQSDRFRFEYEPFHREVFRQLRFTASEAQRTGDGLDVRTLDLPPGAATLLAMLRPWSRMQRLHRWGLSRGLTIPSLLSVWRSGAIGMLSVETPDARHAIHAGRVLQRIWLAADAERLSLHPLGSLPIFLAQEEVLQGRHLSVAHRRLAGQLGVRLRRLAPTVAGRTLVMLFRLGYSAPSCVRSLRRPLHRLVVPVRERNSRDLGS